MPQPRLELHCTDWHTDTMVRRDTGHTNHPQEGQQDTPQHYFDTQLSALGQVKTGAFHVPVNSPPSHHRVASKTLNLPPPPRTNRTPTGTT
uniref:Uncharacterized protein n=1 Tax=Knipowitschia caucasica TaxID=637954 RepID=A0AAV2KXR4_KNICA